MARRRQYININWIWHGEIHYHFHHLYSKAGFCLIRRIPLATIFEGETHRGGMPEIGYQDQPDLVRCRYSGHLERFYGEAIWRYLADAWTAMANIPGSQSYRRSIPRWCSETSSIRCDNEERVVLRHYLAQGCWLSCLSGRFDCHFWTWSLPLWSRGDAPRRSDGLNERWSIPEEWLIWLENGLQHAWYSGMLQRRPWYERSTSKGWGICPRNNNCIDCLFVGKGTFEIFRGQGLGHRSDLQTAFTTITDVATYLHGLKDSSPTYQMFWLLGWM